MMGLKRVSSFRQWNLVGFILVLLCSNAFAAKVAPLYFESLGASSSENSVAQQAYWDALMKYKLWGTHGILFNKEHVTIREQSGYTGTASGNVTFNNGYHTLGGPILVGGSLLFAPDGGGMKSDTLLGGPVRVLGDVTMANWATGDIAISKYEGAYCVQGDVKTNSSISGDPSVGVWVDSLDAFYGSALTADGAYADCPSTGKDSVPHVDTFLSVPRWTKPDSVPWGAEVLVSNMTTNKIAYIQVPPEDASVSDVGVYDLYLESIRMKGVTGLKVYILMPPGGRLTRILLRDTLEIESSANDAEIRVIYANEDATFDRITGTWTWDSSKATHVSNADYAGNLLIYSPKGIDWNEMIKPVFQGTYMTPGTFTLKDHLILAGQLIADSLHFESDITGDFRYVPFDPPVITLDDPTTGTLTTLIEGNPNPQQARFYFRDADGDITPTKTEVTFTYCFSFQDTVGMDSIAKLSYAIVEDLDTLGLPLCASGTADAVTVSAGSSYFDITSSIYNDILPEKEYEKFSIYFSNLTGAVLAGNQREGSVTLSIKDNDSAPVAQDEVFRGYEDQEFVFSVDSFTVNMPIAAIRVVTLPAKDGISKGSFYLRDASGTVTPVTANMEIATADLATLYFLASPDEYDSVEYATFTFDVKSAEGIWSVGTNLATIQIMPVNDVPTLTLGADSVVVMEDTALVTFATWATITTGAANEAPTLTATLTTDYDDLFSVMPHLDVATGTLTFTPAPDSNGVANVTIRLCDSGSDSLCVDSLFTIKVLPVNDAPAYVLGPDVTVKEDSGAVSDTAWATAISKGPANEAFQTLTFTLTTPDSSLFSVQPAVDSTGKLTFTTAPNANGVAIISIRLQDNGDTAFGGVDTTITQTFTITITSENDPPTFVASTVRSFTVLEDAVGQSIAAWATLISSGAANEASQTLQFVIESNSHASLFLVGPALDSITGNLTYTAAPDSNGSAFVVVKLCEVANPFVCSDTASFTINVTPVNDAPAYALGSNVTVKEDSGAVRIAAWATAISKGPANESLQTLTFTLATPDSALFSVQPAVDSMGMLTFTTASDVNGVATISIRLEDDGGVVDGGVDTTITQTFTITITSENDSPTFVASTVRSFTVLEDVVGQSIAAWATLISSGPSNEALQTLQFVIESNSHASLFSAGPALDSLTGNLTYTAAPDSNGSAFVVVKLCEVANPLVCSDTASFTINVTPVNDAPAYVLGTDVTVKEDSGAVSIAAWATAISKGPSNEASQTLTFTVTTPDSALFSVQPIVDASGKLIFTTAPDANGVATISIRLRDNGGVADGGVDTTITRTFTITITSENDTPVLVLDSTSVTIDEDAGSQQILNFASIMTAGAANESAQILTISLSANNAALFVAPPAIDIPSGDLTYTPAADANGTAAVFAELCDDLGACALDTFEIRIIPVNDRPHFVMGDSITLDENKGLQSHANWATSINPGAYNEAGQSLHFVVKTSTTSLFSEQPAINASGKLTFTTTTDKYGTASVNVLLCDDGEGVLADSLCSPVDSFSITVLRAINEIPQLTLSDTVIFAETLWEYTFSGVDSDTEDKGNLTYTLLNTVPAGLQLDSKAGSGSISWTPDASMISATPYTITVQVKDVMGATSTGTFKVTVRRFNHAPVVITDTLYIDENSSHGTSAGTLQATDADKDVLSWTLTGGTGKSMFTVNATTGVVSLNTNSSLDYEAQKSYTLQVSVADGYNYAEYAAYAGSVSHQVLVLVRDVNEAPVILTEVIAVLENTQGSLGTIAYQDPDTNTCKFTLLADTSGKFTVTQNGTLVLKDSAILDYEAATQYTVTVIAKDPGGLADTADITINLINQKELATVEITRGSSRDSVWLYPDTIYTNVKTLDIEWTENGVLHYGTETLMEGKNVIIKTYYDPTMDSPGVDTLVIYVNTDAPMVSLQGPSKDSSRVSSVTIVEQQAKGDTAYYVNEAINQLSVSVVDSSQENVSRSFSVSVKLDTVAVTSSIFNTMETVHTSVDLHENGYSWTYTSVNGTETRVSRQDTINGKVITIAYYTDKNGNRVLDADGNGTYEVSYSFTAADGTQATITYVTDASGNRVSDADGNVLYTITYEYEDSKGNAVLVSYGVNENGKEQRDADGNLLFQVTYSYEDGYGNVGQQTIKLVLDRVAPKVVIISPEEQLRTSNVAVEVLWTVDGVEQDTLTLQGLKEGVNMIVRTYRDLAGNEGSDTVYVVLKDGRAIIVTMEAPLIDLNPATVEKYYSTNPPESGDKFAVSFLNVETGLEEETLAGSESGTVKGSGEEPYPGLSGTHLGPTLVIHAQVPSLNELGSSAKLGDLIESDGLIAVESGGGWDREKVTVQDYVEKYCSEDFASTVDYSDLNNASLYTTTLQMRIWIFSTLGQFVDDFGFSQSLVSDDYLNEAGVLTMYFEVKPDGVLGLRSDDGKLYGSGAYIFKTSVKMISELQCELPDAKLGSRKVVSDEILETWGYSRPKR